MAEETLCLEGQVWTPQGPLDGGWVLVRGGVIAAVGRARERPRLPEGVLLRDLGDHMVLPGFIDLHLHGFGSHSFLGPPGPLAAALRGAAAALPASGVTCFLAGWTGLDPADALRFLEAAAPCLAPLPQAPPSPAPGAVAAGLYLEGPWLRLTGPLQAGRGSEATPAHRAAWATLRGEALALAEQLMERGRGLLRLITVAPELPGARAVIAALAGSGVTVALGHTRASYRTCLEAVSAGASHVTHVFNCMGRWHHRRPGVAGAALLDPWLRLEVIPDGVHLHPAAVELAWRLKGRGGLVAVSDQVGPVPDPGGPAPEGLGPGGPGPEGLGPGGPGPGSPRRAPSGRLIGGGTPANRLLEWLWTETPIPRLESLDFLTRNPARILGLGHRKGGIEPGRDADLVVLDAGFEVRLTLVGGRIAHDATAGLRCGLAEP